MNNSEQQKPICAIMILVDPVTHQFISVGLPEDLIYGLELLNQAINVVAQGMRKQRVSRVIGQPKLALAPEENGN